MSVSLLHIWFSSVPIQPHTRHPVTEGEWHEYSASHLLLWPSSCLFPSSSKDEFSSKEKASSEKEFPVKEEASSQEEFSLISLSSDKVFWFLSLSKSVFRIEREKEETLVDVSKWAEKEHFSENLLLHIDQLAYGSFPKSSLKPGSTVF